MKKLIIIFLIAFQMLAKGQNKLPVELIGFWHNMREFNGHWQDCYNFFPDSTFNFHFDPIAWNRKNNQFYHKGTWRVVKDTLELSIKERKVLVDGEFFQQIDQDGVVTIYQAGFDTIIKLDIPEIKKLKLKMIFKFDGSTESININDEEFWKIDKDPYSKTFN